jgi:hypothetical protein
MRQDGSGKLFHPGWQAYYRAAVLATLLPKSGNNYVLATRAAEKAHTKGALQ